MESLDPTWGVRHKSLDDSFAFLRPPFVRLAAKIGVRVGRYHLSFVVFNDDTGTLRILSVIAKRWAAPIMSCLSTGDKRPNELMHQIGGVSQKMLIQTLRQMEDCRLVARKVHAVVPPRVDYGLTPLGISLIASLQPLSQWMRDHADELAEIGAWRAAGRKPSR